MNQLRRLAALLVGGALAAAAVGCAPTTQYRYTAFTPAAHAIAWDGRTPAEGSVTLEGSLTESTLHENFAPKVGDTAMMVPQWTAEGAAMVSIVSKVQLGLRASIASYDWAQPSAVGTMPVPGSPASWGFGPEMRIAVPLDAEKRFYLGFVGNVLATQVPYAEWSPTGPMSTTNPTPCAPSPTCVTGYSLANAGTETDLVYSLGLIPSYAFGEDGRLGHLFAGVTATTGFHNAGFTNTPQTGNSLGASFPLFVAQAGYAANVEALRLSGMIFHPITDGGSAVDYGLGVQFTVGFALEAWEARHADL